MAKVLWPDLCGKDKKDIPEEWGLFVVFLFFGVFFVVFFGGDRKRILHGIN